MLESDSNIEVKICSVIRGMMPASSGESISAPFAYCKYRVMYNITTHISYHHSERLARPGLSVSEHGPIVAIEDIYSRHVV